MIDRVGSLSLPPRLDRAERGPKRPDTSSEFESLMRGAGNDDASMSSSSSRSIAGGARSRGAGLLNATTSAAPNPASEPAPAPAVGPETGAATEATTEAPAAPATPKTATAPRPVPAGFTRTTDASAPHLPRYKDVPESAKFPLGPYQKAPQGHGGDWWLVSPFTGPEPWLALSAANNSPKAALETGPVPAGFEQVFGSRPERGAAAEQWDQDLSYFQGTGLPEGFNEAHLEAAKVEFEAWGMGEPVFYQGRYGWQVRFPDSQLPTFETTASTALLTPHIVIAEHQVRSIQEGVDLARFHPWLPERLRA